jgi:hypothetical protein
MLEMWGSRLVKFAGEKSLKYLIDGTLGWVRLMLKTMPSWSELLIPGVDLKFSTRLGGEEMRRSRMALFLVGKVIC